MKGRVVIFTALLALLAGGFLEWRKRGWVREGEQWFVDFLVANGRDAMEENLPEVSAVVVLVEFGQKAKEELEEWPPPLLDWLVVMKRIAAYEPEVLVILDPLRWEGEDSQLLLSLRQVLLPFPSVVMGFDLAKEPGEMTAEAAEFSEKEMPVLMEGAAGGEAVRFQRVVQVPERTLRLAAETGFRRIEGVEEKTDRVLFVAGDGKRLTPSVAAQAVTLFRRAPYSSLRLGFGAGARLSLGDEFVVPLNPAGAMVLREKPVVPVVDALDLMIPDIGDAQSKQVDAVMGQHKLVVVSLGEEEGMKQARAIAHGVAMPLLHRLDWRVDWALALGAVVLSYGWALKRSRAGAFAYGLGVFALGVGASLVAFHSFLVWWSPLPMFLVVAAGMGFGILWPWRKASQDGGDGGTNQLTGDGAIAL